MWRPDSKIHKHVPVTARSPNLLCLLWQNKSPNKESFYLALLRNKASKTRPLEIPSAKLSLLSNSFQRTSHVEMNNCPGHLLKEKTQ